MLLHTDSFILQKFFKYVLIAVEDVDIHVAADASDVSVVAQLPVNQFDFGLVFSVAGYPYFVVSFDVWRKRKVFVYENLIDIEDRADAYFFVYDVHPSSDALEHFFWSAHFFDFLFGWFHVENGRQVAFLEAGMLKKKKGLIGWV